MAVGLAFQIVSACRESEMACTMSLSHAKRQSGLTLVELMIAMLLGSIMVAGAVQIFSSNVQAFRLQQVVSSVQESGRLAMEMIQADLRRAGMGNPVDAGGVAIPGLTLGNARTAAGTGPGLLVASDYVQVAYEAPEDMADCEGNQALAGQTIINRYYVQVDPNPNISALFCNGQVVGGAAGAARIALVRGVQSFQVQVGVHGAVPAAGRAEVNGYGSPRRYVNPAAMAAGNSIAVAVRVGLVMRSEQGVQGLGDVQNTLTLLDTTIAPATLNAVQISGARPVHRIFVKTVALRNSPVATPCAGAVCVL